MPNLLIFAPCEKIIFDDRANASLIILLNTLTVAAKGDAAIPKEAISPKEWAVFTVWHPNEGDVGQEFVEFLQMLKPDGTEFKQAQVKFSFEANDKVAQVRMNIVGFPVGQTGPLTLNMWLEHHNQRVGEIHSYPVVVAHAKESELANA
jgi:hypothetical protein